MPMPHLFKDRDGFLEDAQNGNWRLSLDSAQVLTQSPAVERPDDVAVSGLRKAPAPAMDSNEPLSLGERQARRRAWRAKRRRRWLAKG